MFDGKAAKSRSGPVLALLAVGATIVCTAFGASAALAAGNVAASPVTPGAGYPAVTAVTSAIAPPSAAVAVPSAYLNPETGVVTPATRESRLSSSAFPVYYITSTNKGYLSGIHRCRLIGNDGINQGVECADLYAVPDSSDGFPGVDVSAAAEGFCQNLGNTSDYPACQAIDIGFQAAQAGGTITPFWGLFCGAATGGPNCTTGRQSEIADGAGAYIHQDSITGCVAQPGTVNEYWTTLESGDSIQLPSGTQVAVGGNWSSQHAIVCPG